MVGVRHGQHWTIVLRRFDVSQTSCITTRVGQAWSKLDPHKIGNPVQPAWLHSGRQISHKNPAGCSQANVPADKSRGRIKIRFPAQGVLNPALSFKNKPCRLVLTNNKPDQLLVGLNSVGAPRFELGTSCSQSRRANRAALRPVVL